MRARYDFTTAAAELTDPGPVADFASREAEHNCLLSRSETCTASTRAGPI